MRHALITDPRILEHAEELCRAAQEAISAYLTRASYVE
jgi:hypothetical protein